MRIKLMSKKFRKIALLAMLSVFALSLFAGCTLGATFDQVIKDNNLVAHITYHANGGYFGGNLLEKNIYYTEGARPINISSTDVSIISGSVNVTRSKFEFGGWFEAKLDSSGNPVVGEDGLVVIDETKPLDTEYRMKNGDHFVYYALWVTEIKVDLRFVTEDGNPLTFKKGDEEVTYNSGDVYKSYGFGDKNSVQAPSAIKETVKDKAYTWTQQYFYDEACTQKVIWPVVPDGSNENISIYTKYICGDWQIISTIKTLNSFVTESAMDASVKGYLISDIDCGGALLKFGLLNGYLQGNGFKIHNFIVQENSRNDTVSVGSTLSFIGTVSANAKLENITFENIRVSATLMPPIDGQNSASVYALIGGVEEGATFTNVAFKNISLTLRFNPEKSYIENIQKPDGATEYDTSNWLFKCEGTDAQFLTTYTGITVEQTAIDIQSL